VPLLRDDPTRSAGAIPTSRRTSAAHNVGGCSTAAPPRSQEAATRRQLLLPYQAKNEPRGGSTRRLQGLRLRRQEGCARASPVPSRRRRRRARTNQYPTRSGVLPVHTTTAHADLRTEGRLGLGGPSRSSPGGESRKAKKKKIHPRRTSPRLLPTGTTPNLISKATFADKVTHRELGPRSSSSRLIRAMYNIKPPQERDVPADERRWASSVCSPPPHPAARGLPDPIPSRHEPTTRRRHRARHHRRSTLLAEVARRARQEACDVVELGEALITSSKVSERLFEASQAQAGDHRDIEAEAADEEEEEVRSIAGTTPDRALPHPGQDLCVLAEGPRAPAVPLPMARGRRQRRLSATRGEHGRSGPASARSSCQHREPLVVHRSSRRPGEARRAARELRSPCTTTRKARLREYSS